VKSEVEEEEAMLRRVDVVPKKSEKKFKVTSHVFLKI
jgi:hypothetical protein